ncbi:metal ABC transporter substrate-binding protein [Paenibacillus filicis]|uniref:Metal ABC transporter substrate-binding protein n=1 Tax=Paenibacillus gyeongsangnamensis TaxID=3388067 RepID=A0ABT4QJ77_9BACL|nr:metal ABC transporter substrate-binding protein [Paenibacillus filicis]MCZ8516756.1 metal ABC transporter substrate-binding protein [Paenibacillus filicis]
MLKKYGLLMTSLLLAVALFVSACGKPQASLVKGKINIVASFYPLYDFASKIGGSHVNVINLVPAGVEPHDWEPKSRDIQNITKSDLLLYLGAGFEGWVDHTVGSLPKDAKVTPVETSKGISFMKATEEENAPKGDKSAKEGAYDPHVWLSPVNAKLMAQNIKDALVKVDAAHQADYEVNFKKLSDQLDQLNTKYKTKLAPLPNKDIVVSHQAFAYLAKEYGLVQKPIMGLSPDAEPTSKDMKDIIQFVKDNHVKYIFFEELVSDKLAKTLAKDAGVQTMVLNPLEGLTEEQSKQGADYVSIMENNLNNLIKALQ